ncbi:MAG: hypothetical protein JXP48_06870 [Acidobacteria bacterium]|nr:hypothetical protein [Acidobacteriota bacterium]
MKHRSQLFFLAILGAALLCLTFSGCATGTQQTSELEDPEQPATEDTTELAAPAAAPAPARTARPAAATRQPAPAPAAAPAPAVRAVSLPPGTPVAVVTSSPISTKTHKTGDVFEASLDRDIVDGNRVVARRGALVTGIVAESDPGGRVKGVASLSLKLTRLTLDDGQEVSIVTDAYGVQAKTSVKKDATKVGIGAGIGAAIGAIAGGGKGAAIGAGVGGAAGTGAALATHGNPAEVASETPITFELTAPLEASIR